jgi:predicted PurR-regulated permease PerM/methylmalonyl-CoA mutase cobalamin-binding subunit
VPTLRRKTSVMNHPVVITFLILAVIAAMSLAAEVLKPLALSVLLAFALTPPASALERRGLPRAAAVALTVILTLAALGGVGFVVGRQLESLANRLPGYQSNIEKKMRVFQPNDKSAIAKAKRVASDVAEKLYTSPLEEEDGDKSVTAVRVVQQPTYRERLQTAVGPYLEYFGVGSFVLILVMFMLMSREDLRDRIVSLFGHSRVSLTTRTMDEIGQRISRYLATFAMVNSAFGLVIGLGLWAIGVPYAVLWGCLAAILRFIPYVGPAVAFVLPLTFSFAHFEGWREPLLVVALFAVVETALNSFLEPVIYGKTTGVSALGLLVAAMFWTWLWGLLGILLSTPLTVCLAVLGKYVPSLGVFATLLGEEAELDPDVRFYQRLVALDRDGAVELVEAEMKSRPRVEVYDTVLVPALSRAERDAAEGFLEDQDLAFVLRVVGEIVDEQEGLAEITLDTVASDSAATAAGSGNGKNAVVAAYAGPAPLLLGIAGHNTADAVVLKMLAQVLDAAGLTLELVTDALTPLELAGRVAEQSPAVVVLSHLPPAGLTEARYQVRRLRARFGDLAIVVGRWGVGGNTAAAAAERLVEVGASHVSPSLVDARAFILKRLAPAQPEEEIGSAAAVSATGKV